MSEDEREQKAIEALFVKEVGKYKVEPDAAETDYAGAFDRP
jgi:hypothetical protein